MAANGYNPLRWDCKSGENCYNQTVRPRIEEFAGCFPGKISMSDIDGAVEIGGRFLFLEWKSSGGSLTSGQRIMFERLTKLSEKITVVLVEGHPREMTVSRTRVFWGGKDYGFQSSSFDDLYARIQCWAQVERAA